MNKMGEDGDPALTVFQINNDGFDVQSFALL
ncbi:bacteriophage protein [Mycobacteroides abscessus subsp. abscessus]|nr:bacteriophage protein [Mycobacteroides abscessus subsp. abscessus]